MIALNVLGRGSSIGALSLCYVYSAEVFPTVTRNVGLGSSSLWVNNKTTYAMLVTKEKSLVYAILAPKENK